MSRVKLPFSSKAGSSRAGPSRSRPRRADGATFLRILSREPARTHWTLEPYPARAPLPRLLAYPPPARTEHARLITGRSAVSIVHRIDQHAESRHEDHSRQTPEPAVVDEDGRTLARRQLPFRRTDLSPRQPAPERAAATEPHQ